MDVNVNIDKLILRSTSKKQIKSQLPVNRNVSFLASATYLQDHCHLALYIKMTDIDVKNTVHITI